MITDFSVSLQEIKQEYSEKRFEEALNLSNKAIEEYPESYEFYQIRSCIFHRMGNFDNAFIDIDTLLSGLESEIFEG